MFKFRQVDTSPEGIRQCREFLNDVFPKKYSYEELNWMYAKNPDGKAIGFNAYHNDRIVSHFVSMPIKARMYGEECKGALSLNIATHPEYQGKKLYDKVSNLAYEYANEKGFLFLIGVANAAITPIYINKQNYQLVKPLDVKIGIGNINEINQNYDDYEYKRIWTKETLQWRLSNPTMQYKFIKKKSVHYAIAPNQKLGIGVLLGKYNADFLAPDFLKEHRGINPVNIWMGVDHNIRWKSSLYMYFPDKLKPSPLNLIFKDLGNSGLQLNPEKTLFNSMDFDVY